MKRHEKEAFDDIVKTCADLVDEKNNLKSLLRDFIRYGGLTIYKMNWNLDRMKKAKVSIVQGSQWDMDNMRNLLSKAKGIAGS